MNNIRRKKFFPILLGALFVFSSIMTVSAFAASPVAQDGLSAALTSDKTAYAANEDVDISLTVTNNNSYTVNGIQTSITLPSGITIKSGSLTEDMLGLSAGESKTKTATLIKTVPAAQTQSNTSSKDPKTGDNQNVTVWLMIMLISAGAMIALAVKNKKINIKNVLSLFLCLAVLGILGLPLTVEAAGTQKSFTVTEDLTLDGKAATISAKISYDYVAHYAAAITGGKGSADYAEGDTVTITADANPTGKHFSGWTVVSGDITLADSTQSTTTFIMPANAVEVTAGYDDNVYKITSASGLNGTVSPTGDANVKHGESKTFTITADEDYHIKDVFVDGTRVGKTNEYTFTNVTADGHTISATFAKDMYRVTVINGEVQDGILNVAWGETVTIVTNTSVRDEEFLCWLVTGDSVPFGDKTKEKTTFTMPKENVEITAGYSSSYKPAKVTEMFKSYFYTSSGAVKANRVDGYMDTEWAVAVTDVTKIANVYTAITNRPVSTAYSYTFSHSSFDGTLLINAEGYKNADAAGEYAIMTVQIPDCPEITKIHIVSPDYFNWKNPGGDIVYLN